MKELISPGAAKITSARSPIIHALSSAGEFFQGHRYLRQFSDGDCAPIHDRRDLL